MNILVSVRHMEVTDSIREDMEAERPVAEIVVTATKKHTFVATHRAGDMEDLYACVDKCFDKVSEQLRRFKDKVRGHKHDHKQ